MTVTALPTIVTPYAGVGFDLYRDIHKGIRAELFAVTGTAGRIDPSHKAARLALQSHVRSVVDLLVMHAEHEDASVQPWIERIVPDVAETIVDDHAHLEARMVDLQVLASDAAIAEPDEQRLAVQRLYVELASFTSSYLAHQDLEERVVMPALFDAVGFDGALAINQEIVGSLPPEVMTASLAIMLPAMNVDDRTELLGGMQHGAPPEVFQGVWALTGTILPPADYAALGTRLGLA
jgi:hypothetical protein